MKIMDLNIDCQETIFRHLDYVELYNVADSNARLREAAKLVYRIKYGRMPVRIGEKGYENVVAYPPNLKITFKLLRYFENSISHVYRSPQNLKILLVLV